MNSKMNIELLGSADKMTYKLSISGCSQVLANTGGTGRTSWSPWIHPVATIHNHLCLSLKSLSISNWLVRVSYRGLSPYGLEHYTSSQVCPNSRGM